jgi:glycosyltransferase involved in cell wall biosynthesis
LARRAITTIVTNDHFADRVRAWGGHALVLRDIPTTFPDGGTYPVEQTFNVVVVNTFAPDEPVGEVLAAAADLGDVRFHITGDTNRPGDDLPTNLPPNARFTGFLSDEDYYALLRASDAVMCLTTRDHTMQRGACEALSLGVPIITSDWPLLKDYFSKGTVYVDNTAPDIRRGVDNMLRHHDRFVTEIRELQVEQRREWEQALSSLSELLTGAAKPGAQTEKS